MSYRTSKHSSVRSVSTKYGGDNADSAVNLPQLRKDLNSKKSRLQEARSTNDEDPSPTATAESEPHDEQSLVAPVYPSGPKTALIMVSLYISIFLVALDRTIMGPAIPAITNQFHSIDDIGWYGSAYMLTSAGFILLYGRIYTFFPTKPVFLSGIFLFELGSTICGAAQSSMMLIIGRAIAGLGSGGIFTGAILIMLNVVPLHKRPMLQGLFGACFGVASVAGPLLGGAFTGSSATWRWCFYINLPLGGLTVFVVCFFLQLEEKKPKLANWKETAKHLDPLGTALFLPSITCLLLALEWGSEELSWGSPRIIATLVVFSVLFLGFVFWQYLTRHTTATVPARIILQRSVACGGVSQFCVGATMLTVSIYIPLWFQAIKGVSAMQSGINTIPLVLSVVVGSISSGGLVQRIGYYTPFMVLGSSFMAIGAGLLTTWNMGTENGMWIGYQIILGIGVGWTMQQPNLAVQTILSKNDVPIGTAVLSLCQTLGGAVFAAVGQNLYIDKFTKGLEHIGGLDPEHILDAGATDLTKNLPATVQQQVLKAYNNSLTKGTFFAALIIACLAVPAALGMEWRSVKDRQAVSTTPEAHDEENQEQPVIMLAPHGSREKSGTEPSKSVASGHILVPPPPVWKRLCRSSGHFSSYLTAKVNPDLRPQLKTPREG
ncbi:major facilitator superfamily transporter [Plenodomus tracheiphilus IPT5]|uniref:Major facilitator superfamily transporter n=1 Tax=Plenodomus tracheiphilus IPT5 TaxID=1408161 RepID=A0A6A7AU50_9PLEO|nr:major facilitator superfamily transporter [Plenodomus tracheiphilus IPT5]